MLHAPARTCNDYLTILAYQDPGGNMEWSQVLDVSHLVSFNVPEDHTYTNEYVLSKQYAPYGDGLWHIFVFDGWDGKHSGGDGALVPSNWEVV